MSAWAAGVTVPLHATEGLAERPFRRADIVLENLEQGGPSFELRVFIGNPGASPDTPQSPDAGYAGSVHVYGYGTPPPLPAGVKPGRVRAPMRRAIDASQAVRAWLVRGDRPEVTLVAIPADADSTPTVDVDLAAVMATLQLDPPGS